MVVLTEKQQRIFEWLNKLQLPVYAGAYKGAVSLLREKSSGYGTFVSHTGRDLMNSLARAAVGIPSGRSQYEQLIDNLEKKWQDKRHRRGPISHKYMGKGHVISQDICAMITNLIEKNKEGRRRNQEARELFFDMFLGSPDKDKDAIRKQWKEVRGFFLKCAHLREEDFSDEVLSKIAENFRTLEEFLYIAAEREYSRMKTLDNILEETNNSRKKPISKKVKQAVKRAIERTLALFENKTDRHYFFSRLKNPQWIQPLSERGCFKSPPSIRYLPDGHVQYPFWPELQYLKNVCKDAPEEVIRLLLQLPAVDNPRIYDTILDIALELDGKQSVQLKSKMLEYAELEHQFLHYRYLELLAHWIAENQNEAALELANILVQFAPDPRAQEKEKQRREDSDDPIRSMMNLLSPAPRFNDNYQEILNDGVRPLVEKEPYQIACMLIDATANMIRFRGYQDDLESGESYDSSETWCPRLNKQSRDYPDSRETLVYTLTYACEKVYEQSPMSVAALDDVLRNQRWYVFKRLRQHLYALHPSEQTKPWIRELILTHGDYEKWKEHPYEFQRMIRLACEHFGAELLTEDERTQIFDAILNGFSKEYYREWMGEQFTETGFEQLKRHFHRIQLRPFVSVLFGKYVGYFQELKNDETAEDIGDESYSPLSKSEGGMVTPSSPKSSNELLKLSDAELLDYINKWQDEHRDKDNWLIEISIPALAGAFQSVFTESIIPDDNRLNFWIEKSREQIKRPIYVRSMIQAMHIRVKEGNFEQLNRWLDFCKWVISHSDEEPEEDIIRSETFQENPSWRYSRRAVITFVEDCLKEEINVPISTRKRLAEILEMLCTQFDWVLNQKLNQDDPLTKAINSTCGLALENLVNFGLWVRRHDDKTEVSEITTILEKRFGSEAEYLLTIPEYAILGMRYGQFLDLNEAWVVKHKSDFFPKNNIPAWVASFGTFLHYSHPHKQIFDIVRDDFEFALEHLDRLKEQKQSGRELIDILGEHLFNYYFLDIYPLTGENSLLECFYQKSNGERKHWATLFGYIGRLLRNTHELDEGLKDRVNDFFEWRLEFGEPTEFREFTFWLEAKCLEAEWRLDAYSKILDAGPERHQRIMIGYDVKALHAMLPEHPARVVECFAKLTDSTDNIEAIYIQTNQTKAILRAGRNCDDESVRENVRQARENLLHNGQFSFLDLND